MTASISAELADNFEYDVAINTADVSRQWNVSEQASSRVR